MSHPKQPPSEALTTKEAERKHVRTVVAGAVKDAVDGWFRDLFGLPRKSDPETIDVEPDAVVEDEPSKP